MVEFNADGSIRLPGVLQQNKDKNEHRMKSTRCLKIRKEAVSTYAPKKCVLYLELSTLLPNNFVEQQHNFFKLKSETKTVLTKIDEKNFEIEIHSDFKRCSECRQLVSRYREFMDGSVIEDKGTCTLKERAFAYEDHFD